MFVLIKESLILAWKLLAEPSSSQPHWSHTLFQQHPGARWRRRKAEPSKAALPPRHCPLPLANEDTRARHRAPDGHGPALSPSICTGGWICCLVDYRKFSALFYWVCCNSIPTRKVLPLRSPASPCPPAPRRARQTRWQVLFNCHQLICCSFDEDY